MYTRPISRNAALVFSIIFSIGAIVGVLVGRFDMAALFAFPFLVGALAILKYKVELRRREICRKEAGLLTAGHVDIASVLSNTSRMPVEFDPRSGRYVFTGDKSEVSARDVALAEADLSNGMRAKRCSLFRAFISLVREHRSEHSV